MRFLLFFILPFYIYANEPITPIPNHIEYDSKKATLGKELFFDPILSANKTISCASCHNLFEGGDDNRAKSIGIRGKLGGVNAPTVYNAVFNFSQFWDGRAKDLQEQAAGPIENPVEMGNNFKDLIKTLNKTKYKDKFDAIYKDGITKANITDAIAEFEKTLITPDSPFDRYLRGDESAISKMQKEGYELFKNKGCISCHNGVNVGGNMYNKFGTILPTQDKNLGRYNVTKDERDKYYFKVPSLRNIAKTAPYFHNGSVNSLHKAVYFMAKFQLGRDIPRSDIDKIVAFLKSLSGKLPTAIKEER